LAAVMDAVQQQFSPQQVVYSPLRSVCISNLFIQTDGLQPFDPEHCVLVDDLEGRRQGFYRFWPFDVRRLDIEFEFPLLNAERDIGVDLCKMPR
jgi:hypothetical protein